MWIETNPSGSVNEEHEINVFFGEFSHDVREDAGEESFDKVKKFELWITDQHGEKTILEAVPNGNHYTASFVPTNEGVYTVVLNNDKIEVLDFSKYDFGIFKTHYHASAKIQIGKEAGETSDSNDQGIAINNLSNDAKSVQLEVTYQGKAMSESEITVFLPQGWTKTLETDEKGTVAFELPWESTYLIEVATKEEIPGTYEGKEYEFIYHCATLSITKENQ